MIATKDIVVYTSIVGNIDALKECQVTDGIAFHAFVDSDIVSATWTTHRISGLFKDSRRTARMYKILAHQYFPDAEVNIWIDGTISVTRSLRPLIDEFVHSGKDLATFRHPERDCLYAEAEACKNLRLDDFESIDRQIAAYRAAGYPDHQGLYESSVLIRRNNDHVRAFNNFWWSENCAHSRRDQLSMPYALHATGLCADILPGNPQNIPEISPNRTGSIYFSWTDHASQAHFDTTPAPTREDDLRASFAVSKTGARIYVDSRDRRGQALIDARGDFNPNSLQLWDYLVHSRAWPSIIDIGANYGEMLLNLRFPENAKVIAVEPNLAISRYLECSLADAGYGVELIRTAIAETTGIRRFFVDADWSGTSRILDEAQNIGEHPVGDVVELATLSLSELLDQIEGLDRRDVLLKVDVEGHEVAVFSSLEPRFSEFLELTALVEILHLGQVQLAWFLERFHMYLLDLQSRALVKVEPRNLVTLQAMLATNRYYPQDAVVCLNEPTYPATRANPTPSKPAWPGLARWV